MSRKRSGLNKQEELEKLEKFKFDTPMMQQYLKIKKEYADCLLLFRLGDFYELFLDDAKIAAEILGITLTSRKRGRDGRIPMCGVPYHALDSYLGKLIKAGYKVAICEQVSEPSESGEMVEREVVRVVTPGTILDDKNLVQKENNFILGLSLEKKFLGLAYADLSTGEFYLRQVRFKDLKKTLQAEILRIKPIEVVSSHRNYNNPELLRAFRVASQINIYPFDGWEKGEREHLKILKKHFSVATLEGFGIKAEKQKQALKAAASLLVYLKQTQKSKLVHFKKITLYQKKEYLKLDPSTIVNLELFSTLGRQNRGSALIDILDNTHTAAGGRRLKKWLLQPSTSKKMLKTRLDAVGLLTKKVKERDKVQALLGQILDIERLISRVSVGTADPRDLVGLKTSLQNSVKIAKFLKTNLPELGYLFSEKLIKELMNIADFIGQNIKPDPPATLTDGGYIADGVSSQLDEYREIVSGSKNWLKKFQQEQRQATGIETLKIDRNKIYGFYIEVSKSNQHKVPDYYIRKQTLVNSERYIVPKLKEREEKSLQAEEMSKKLERQLFEEILDKLLEFTQLVQNAAEKIATLDVYCSLAQIAQKQRYTRPKLIKKGKLEIIKGRHPVIELVQEEQSFIPNDTKMNQHKEQILIITGPNMAGKSTYLRQVALITLMAQIGSFVPADKATIPIRDQIFTRVGATDNISLGQSTFLVEMIETANILNNCTPKSLIVFDEIGRGTSTFDGMGIAWAVVEYLAKNKTKQALTLFATHYHELTNLSQKYDQIKNYQMAIKKEAEGIVFLYQVVPGSAWHSYGIEVAKLAGLPQSVINQARYILQKTKKDQKELYRGRKGEDKKRQIDLFKNVQN